MSRVLLQFSFVMRYGMALRFGFHSTLTSESDWLTK
jgi:hypothetical protein